MPNGSSLGRESRRFADQVAHWTPARWRLSAGERTRGDAVHALVQTLADLDADAEHEPRRDVPRLPHDTALADQLRVIADDLSAVELSSSALAEGQQAISAARAALFSPVGFAE